MAEENGAMKRFYRASSVRFAESGWQIELDGKAVRTPGGKSLISPSETLGTLIAAEWGAQEKEIVPASMPMTQILITVIDRVAGNEDDIRAQTIGYLDTDLLCYRANSPAELVRRQESAWNPWLEWFEKQWSMTLETTTGLSALKQPDAAHKAVQTYIRTLDHFYLAILHLATGLSGSLVMGLAFISRQARSEDVLSVMQVEEDYKAGIYGETRCGLAPHAEKQRQSARLELESAEKLMDALNR